MIFILKSCDWHLWISNQSENKLQLRIQQFRSMKNCFITECPAVKSQWPDRKCLVFQTDLSPLLSTLRICFHYPTSHPEVCISMLALVYILGILRGKRPKAKCVQSKEQCTNTLLMQDYFLHSIKKNLLRKIFRN